MSNFYPKFFTWIMLSLSCLFVVVYACDPCSAYQYVRQTDRKFEQKTDHFWKFEEQSNSWVEVKLPYDLVSCINETCTKVGSIDWRTKNPEEQTGSELDVSQQEMSINNKDGFVGQEDNFVSLPLRKRISLIKMCETSIWVTGESGSIYERFWNGLQWVIAPHELPVSAGYATSVFIVNQTILALSEAGNLYQLQLSENSQPVWVEFSPKLNHISSKETEKNSAIRLKYGILSHDRERIYFCTKNGSLLELSEIEPPRWLNHGRPPGANVAAIADACTIRHEVIFTISSAGDLYEYDRSSKPSWKKHIWKEGAAKDTSLTPSKGCSLHGTRGDQLISLFLLTKSGNLVERRLQKKKWKWILHGSPKDHLLTAITLASQDELDDQSYSLFLTTTSGFLFEYQIPKRSGIAPENQFSGNWVNHMHPPHAKVARGIAGLQFQIGRIVFPLDDGRLAELHLSGLGGESSGPIHHINIRKTAPFKYVWSIIDAPETEGWNAEYCSEERGPSNCITGIKDETSDTKFIRSTARKKKGGKEEQEAYLSPGTSGSYALESMEDYSMPYDWINLNFRLRLMQEGRSFFLITNGGLTFEYLHAENVWFWLRHEHVTSMRGALGNYNGSLFLVDEHGSLLMRERSISELEWINCTAMKKGRHVIGGPPWDGVPGRALKSTGEDSIFFVSRSGRLLQLTVAVRKFKWKDCKTPSNTKIACIMDQEVFRDNIVFVIGRNGRLYQYNKVTELWHEHHQSQHLILSRVPGTSMRPSPISLTGSLVMLSESGGLVEYQWNLLDGWNWVEHGTPYKNVTLVGSPGPCFQGNQLFLIGSDGNVYLRYLDQGTWKWRNCGFPHIGHKGSENEKQVGEINGMEKVRIHKDMSASLEKIEENCNQQVAPTRPIPFAVDSIIFELRDGRLAEMRRIEDMNWMWTRTIGTPTSLCIENYWTAVAS